MWRSNSAGPILTPSTNKKVLVSRFDRETLAGFVNPGTYLQPDGLELLRVNGTVLLLPFMEVKTVAFVRDFEAGEHKPDIRSFTTRPKMAGLWIRMRFRDGDALDGLLPNNLMLLDGIGFNIVPPDPGYQNQRLFIPKAALTQVEVLGVIGSSVRGGKRRTPGKDQIELFERS